MAGSREPVRRHLSRHHLGRQVGAIAVQPRQKVALRIPLFRFVSPVLLGAAGALLSFLNFHLAPQTTTAGGGRGNAGVFYCILFIAGGAHRPSSTSALGAYSRMARLKSPAGAGSQLDSLS